MTSDEDLQHFSRLIEALRPFLDDLVIVGGWACRLYRYRQDATDPPYPPIFTDDTDVAIPSTIPVRENVRDRLLAHGFTEEFLGEDRPPVTHYRIGEERSTFYAEFLTPMPGGGGRPGRPSHDTAEISGVIAQRLRHLEVLMIEPWRVRLDEHTGNIRADVKVPNAVSFIVQKLLIHKRRSARDRAKDVLYIHDTIELFGASLDDLRVLWLESIAPELPESTVANVKRLAREVCREGSEAVGGAARDAAETGRELTAKTILAVCDEGLSQIFRSRR